MFLSTFKVYYLLRYIVSSLPESASVSTFIGTFVGNFLCCKIYLWQKKAPQLKAEGPKIPLDIQSLTLFYFNVSS